MANTQYILHLKGFVCGADFDRNYVDYVLSQHVGKPVNVLIDSLGGSVATALSIASAFRNHADVAVYFVGMNTSPTTSLRSSVRCSAHFSVPTTLRSLSLPSVATRSASWLRPSIGCARQSSSELDFALTGTIGRHDDQRENR